MTTADPIVQTSQGRLRGARDGGLAVFRGIPFAAPPTGKGRFLPPAPPAPWPEIRDALRTAPAPPQTVEPLSQLLGLELPGPQDEDCLQLDVWTPGTDPAARPVLVWLHGGAFATGSGGSPLYAGHTLAARGDVVVVTLNYRVGALGFAHLAPWLSGAPAGTALNLGLQDQIAALRWVRGEIAAFGGDPDRITVFGESAGAGSLTALLAMPRARGLFRRAIVQSAAPDGMLTADEGRERAGRLLSELGVPVDPAHGRVDLGALQELDVARILEAQQRCIAAGPHRTGMFFAPVVDGKLLPERPLDAMTRGGARDVELVIGTTREEMQLYGTVPGLGEFDDEVLARIVAARLEGEEQARIQRARRAVDLYRRELEAEDRPGGLRPRDLFFALETDLSLRVPSIRLAESHAAVQPRTFMYLFEWRSPRSDGQGGTLGACHALDLPFTFGALDGAAARAVTTDDRPALLEPARRLSDRLMDAWIAFARTGDPSHPGIGVWPAYEPRHRSTMLLGETCRVSEAPLDARRAIWED